MSNRIEDLSWPSPPDSAHAHSVGFAAQVAELVVAKLKDEGIVHDERPPLTEEQAAARLGVSTRVFRDMHRGWRDERGEYHAPIIASILVGKGGRKGVRFEPAELDRYLEGQRRLALSRGAGEDRAS